jgi:hypothetical protein
MISKPRFFLKTRFLFQGMGRGIEAEGGRAGPLSRNPFSRKKTGFEIVSPHGPCQ